MNVPHIVVGVDGSDAAAHALAWAIDEAARRNAEVVAVYASSLVAAAAPPETPLDWESLEAIARDFLEAQVALVAADYDTVVRCRVVNGPPAEALVEASRDADILVVGARGLGGPRGLLLGSVSHRCTQHAACPVVVVHEGADGIGRPSVAAHEPVPAGG